MLRLKLIFGSIAIFCTVTTTAAQASPYQSSSFTLQTSSREKFAPIRVNGQADFDSGLKATVLDGGISGVPVGTQIIVYNPKGQISAFSTGRLTFEKVGLRPVRDDEGITSFFGNRIGSAQEPIFTFVDKKKYEAKENIAAEQSRIAQGKRLEKISTLAQFDKLDVNEKAMLVSGQHIKKLILRDGLALENLSGNDLLFAKKIKEQLEKEVELVPEDDGSSSYGDPEYSFAILTTKTGDILGGEVRAHINGVSDESGPRHFESLEEALAAGGEEGDVSWQVRLVYDFKLEQIDGDTYLEWTGH